MNIRLMPLSSLRIAEQNVRRHTEKQIAEYVRSIKSFEQVKPIVIDDTGEIICGNGLFLALQRMGRTECYCHVMEGITPNQKKKLMLADNRVYELGITDIDAFEEIVKSLGDDVDIPGWDAELIATLNSTPQQVDDFVSGYGSFAPSYTEKIRETQPSPASAPASAAPAVVPAPMEQLQPTSQPAESAPQSPIYPSAQPVETGNAWQTEPTGRFVICPKCGERICL